MSKRIIALKRISNDIKELEKCPLEGIGIAPIANDPMEFVINMELMTGPYRGYKVQLLMLIPDEYPIKPPKVKIYPGQRISNSYHHHILYVHDYDDFKNLCIDLLENRYMNPNEEHTGWNPAYTISSVLIQLQDFLSDPDMHGISDKMIKKLMKSMEKYKRTFKVIENGKEIEMVHTWKDPYPKMFYAKERNEIKQHENLEVIKENLTCYFLRDNYIDNPEILLGYPIIQNKSAFGKDKIELYPIPQLLTYEAFQMQISSNQSSILNTFYDSSKCIKAANNEYYNTWLPIYVNENHYNKNKEKIINSLKAIKNEASFKPDQIFDILPIILNKMIIGMFNGKTIISSAFITCYFQYVLLFKKLCDEYKSEYDSYVNKKINLITMNDYSVNKKIISDIGDFFMLVFLSNKDMTSSEMKRIKMALIEEFLIRQMFWIFHGPEHQEMKSKITNGSFKLKDDKYFDKFESDPDFKMMFLDLFNKELHRKNIYHQVIDIISNDRDFLWNYNNNKKYAKRKAEERINFSFKKLYNECGPWGKNKLKELIKNHMHFSDIFVVDERPMKAEVYESCQVDELLKGNENNHDINDIMKYAYETQKGNQLLLITFAILKKMEQQGFMKELENNYGIYMGVDDFLQEIKQKLNEIKSLKALYEYIGTDLGKDKTDLQLILEAYEKAKEKGYIRAPKEINITQKQTQNVINANSIDNGYKSSYDYGFGGYGYNGYNHYRRYW